MTNTRAREMLGYRVVTEFRSGLERTIAWQREFTVGSQSANRSRMTFA